MKMPQRIIRWLRRMPAGTYSISITPISHMHAWVQCKLQSQDVVDAARTRAIHGGQKAQLCCALLDVFDEGNLSHHLLGRLAPVIQCFLHLARHIKLSAIM